MTPEKKKALMVYGLGGVVVLLAVGAAVAHIVFTHSASPLGPPFPGPDPVPFESNHLKK